MKHGRWRLLKKTSPSGKSLFVCLVCGRVTPIPDKACPYFEQAGKIVKCEEEEISRVHEKKKSKKERDPYEKVNIVHLAHSILELEDERILKELEETSNED